jgi:hypothetical protein
MLSIHLRLASIINGNINSLIYPHARCVRHLLVTPNVVPSSPILVALMMEAVLHTTRWYNHAQYLTSNIPSFSTSYHGHKDLYWQFLLNIQQKLHSFESTCELYRLSDRHWSANFSANFCGYRGVAWSVRRIPHGR